MQKAVEIICITSGIKKEVKVNTTTKEIKDIIFATIELNKEIYVIDVTFVMKQKLEHEIGIVQNRANLNGFPKLKIHN